MLEKLIKLKNLDLGLEHLNIHFVKVHHTEVDSIYVEDEDTYYYYLKNELEKDEVILYKNSRIVEDWIYLSNENIYPSNIYRINRNYYITWYHEGDE